MITCDGLRASRKKTDAVGMSDPIDKDGVRRVLVTVNYLSKFLPNLANVVEPLRRLKHNDVVCIGRRNIRVNVLEPVHVKNLRIMLMYQEAKQQSTV